MLYPSLVAVHLGDQGGSAFYRVVLPTTVAKKQGLIQMRTPNKMIFFPEEILKQMRPDTILFHRSHTPDQIDYINKVKHNLDSMMIYTIDDWVGAVPKESPHYKEIPRGVDKDIRKSIAKCDRLIVTTDTLANVYGYKKDTYIIPNYLSSDIWGKVYMSTKRQSNFNRIPRIGWSGGIGHPGDLRIIREIADILGDSVRWVFLGDIPRGFDQGNSEVHTPVNVIEYAQTLYNLDLDIALAPLLNNDFNRAKSNLRVLEYGACSYPVIASNIKTYANMPITLLDYNAKWWADAIQKKLADREALQQEGEALAKWVWENYKLEDHVKQYGDILSPDKDCFVPKMVTVDGTVDVLITTHNNKNIVERCVTSVLDSIPSNKTPINVIVSDNASNEEGFKAYLEELKTKGVIVLESEIDEGYPNSINKACQVNPTHDVITLNSDTIVNGDWVDRLSKFAHSDLRIASATAITNNGGICSYPNPEGTQLSPSKVRFYDNLLGSLNNSSILVLPSSVNYCTFIKRQVLSNIGLFDSHAFTRGYGEDNDWSMRVLENGLLNVLAPNVYVGHDHGATFGAEKRELLEKTAKTVAIRWQSYPQIVKQWMEAGVLKSLFQLYDIETISKLSPLSRTLFIGHGFGGGLETYLKSQLYKEPQAMVIRNDPTRVGTLVFEVQNDQYYHLPIIDTRLSSMPFLANTFKKFNVNHISIQTTFGYDYTFPIWLMNLAKMMEVDYSVMLHDYLMVCPRLRMVHTTTYCGEPDTEGCNNCIGIYGSSVGQADIKDWRNMYGRLLTGAKKIYSPSHDLANRIKKYFNVDIDVIPHEFDVHIGEINGSLPYTKGEPLKVAVIGSITPDKGSLIIRDCAAYCLEKNIPIYFFVFGNLLDQSAGLKLIDQTNNLRIFNAYKEINLKSMMELNKCHISFFPALWPETYSYTLSHAFRAGLHPVCFDIGAIAERIRDKGFGTILPFNMNTSIPDIVQTLLKTAEGLVNDA